MKTKHSFALALAIATCSTTHAQNTFPANGNVGVGTLAPATSLQVIGTSRFGSGANYAQFDGTGNLSFTGSGNYKVAGNRYAFQYAGNPNFGLFFNSTNVRYEFRDGAAVPVFYVGANDGNAVFTGGVRIGNSTLANAGNLRWTGTDFEGYNGSAWITFATSSNRWGTSGNSGTSVATNFIGTTDAQSFAFRTSNIEKMRLLTDGKLGIGTTAPNARLHINTAIGEDAFRIQISGSTRFLVNDAGGVTIGSTTEAPANTLYVNGNVGIGNSAPVNKLDVTGNVGIVGNTFITGNIDATGTVGFGSVETFSDGGANTIASNSDIVPATTTSTLTLGSSTNRWSSVWAADGTINTSDERDKQNIRDLNYGLKEVMKLRSVKFNWKNAAISNEDKIGFIAQELKKVLPEVVRDYEYKTDETTGQKVKVATERMGVMYADIIPVLIRGMQEQQKMIEDQNKKIDDLTKLLSLSLQNSPASSSAVVSGKTVATGAALEQNAPNPFNSVTTIRYNIPSSAKTAQIMVTNAAGNTVKTFNLSSKGSGNVTINANELSAGSFFYTLIVDGKKADTKQMILIN